VDLAVARARSTEQAAMLDVVVDSIAARQRGEGGQRCSDGWATASAGREKTRERKFGLSCTLVVCTNLEK